MKDLEANAVNDSPSSELSAVTRDSLTHSTRKARTTATQRMKRKRRRASVTLATVDTSYAAPIATSRHRVEQRK
ncbi:hypothetical protein GQ600_21626 [Phytophthora cactorum]|nr:hypothetical protein GQ600_21626 [Phytophthora cactorum]